VTSTNKCSSAPHHPPYSIKVDSKGAFTRVPQVDQRGWINQSEPCKQFLSTEVINGVDGSTSWRWPTFVQRRWFTLGDSPQITRLCLVSLCRVLLLIITRKTVLETSLNDFLYISQSSLLHSTNNVFDAPNVLRLIIHGLTHRRFFLLFLSSKMCWHFFY
jgi:hypothetical protein